MNLKDLAAKTASNPRATRVLLTLAFVALLSLAADPAAAGYPCGPTYDEPVCQY